MTSLRIVPRTHRLLGVFGLVLALVAVVLTVDVADARVGGSPRASTPLTVTLSATRVVMGSTEPVVMTIDASGIPEGQKIKVLQVAAINGDQQPQVVVATLTNQAPFTAEVSLDVHDLLPNSYLYNVQTKKANGQGFTYATDLTVVPVAPSEVMSNEQFSVVSRFPGGTPRVVRAITTAPGSSLGLPLTRTLAAADGSVRLLVRTASSVKLNLIGVATAAPGITLPRVVQPGVQVEVVPQTATVTGPTGPTWGQIVTLTGTATPARPGRRLRLEQYEPGTDQWRSLGVVLADETGSATWPVLVSRPLTDATEIRYRLVAETYHGAAEHTGDPLLLTPTTTTSTATATATVTATATATATTTVTTYPTQTVTITPTSTATITPTDPPSTFCPSDSPGDPCYTG